MLARICKRHEFADSCTSLQKKPHLQTRRPICKNQFCFQIRLLVCKKVDVFAKTLNIRFPILQTQRVCKHVATSDEFAKWETNRFPILQTRRVCKHVAEFANSSQRVRVQFANTALCAQLPYTVPTQFLPSAATA